MVETHIRDGTLRRDGGRELGSSRASAVARERAGRQLTLWRVSSLTDSGASSPAEPGDPNPNPIYLLDTAATYVVAKACHNLVLELSNVWIWSMGSIPSKYGPEYGRMDDLLPQ